MSAQTAMQTLNQQWYNALTTGLGLSPDQFQLYQGNQPVGPTSDWLWKIFNAVPPKSINSSYDPSQMNNFSQDYQAVIANLQPINENSFQTCMGDYFSAWSTYVQTTAASNIFDSPEAMLAVFNKWALVNAPSQMGCSSSLISSYYNNVVTIANVKYAKAQNTGKGFAYNTTIADLKNGIPTAPAKSLTMNSSTQSSNVSHTWAQASASVLFDMFSFGGGANYDNLTQKATSAGVTIQADFQHVLTLPGAPLAETSTDPILGQYTPWYTSAALTRAYGTKDNTVWKPQVPTWDTTFGPNGNLQRLTSALVVVDGITITMTSAAGYTSSEQQLIKAKASTGFWPFFSANGSGGSSTQVTFGDKGDMTVKITCPAGNPQLLGVLVSASSNVLG